MNNKRILLIDDTVDIHEDFRKILTSFNDDDTLFNETKSLLFNQKISSSLPTVQNYEIDSAYQGQQGLELVKQAVASRRNYALAFVDIRMPPGWDGIETVQQLWEVDPDLQIVICTAHSDYSWGEISSRLFSSDNFLILKKPFDSIEIIQLASSLTTKWELKHKLDQQIQHLESTVQRRTADLQKAKNEAEKANKIKTEFLMNISHELLTPLNGILGFANIIATKKLTTADQKDFINTIISSAKQLMQMIKDVIYMSTFETFESVNLFKPEKIDLASLLDEVISIHDNIIKEKRIKINKTIDTKINEIVNDMDQFKRVLFHLVSNAIKFTPNQGKIEIRAFHLDSDKFRIEVIDSGIGVNKDDLHKLFAPFQQLDSGMAKKYQGLGIGLALVRQIIQGQGGQIGLAEHSGPGSTFFIILPLCVKDFA